MATQFFSSTTGEWVGTRWFGGSARGACFDFGARHERAFEVVEAVRSGAQVVSEAGHEVDFEQVVEACEWTFGEYGGTFDVGASDVATFEGF